METLYNLDKTKDILNVDYTDDDVLLQQIILSTQAYIDSCCGVEYKQAGDNYINLAKLLFTQIAKDMYDNREVNISNNTKQNSFYITRMQLLSLCGDEND